MQEDYAAHTTAELLDKLRYFEDDNPSDLQKSVYILRIIVERLVRRHPNMLMME